MYSTYNLKADGKNPTGVHIHRPIHASNVGVAEVLFLNGWYNLPDGGNMTVLRGEGVREKLIFPPGLYSFIQIKHHLGIMYPALENTLSLNMRTVEVCVRVPRGLQIKIGGCILNLLGLNQFRGWLSEGYVYKANRIAPISCHRTLQILMREVDASNTHLDGRPSTVIGHIAVRPSDLGVMTSTQLCTPYMQPISGGEISQVTLELRDSLTGQVINNNGLSVIITLLLN